MTPSSGVSAQAVQRPQDFAVVSAWHGPFPSRWGRRGGDRRGEGERGEGREEVERGKGREEGSGEEWEEGKEEVMGGRRGKVISQS